MSDNWILAFCANAKQEELLLFSYLLEQTVMKVLFFPSLLINNRTNVEAAVGNFGKTD